MKLLPQAGSNSFVGNSFFIFLVRFFPSLANVFVIILFSHFLGKGSYGTYQNFWVQLYVMSTIACLGIQAFVITYEPALVARLVRSMNVKSFLALAGWLTACSIVFSFLQKDIGSTLSFIFLFAYSATIISESLLLVFRRFRLLLLLNVGYTILFCLLHGMFVESPWTFQTLFSWLLLLCIAKALMAVLVAVNSIKRQPIHQGHLAPSKIKKLWLHLGVYDVSQTIFRWIDKFVVSLFLTEELSAIYFNGSLEIPFLPLLLGAAGSAALMHLSTLKEDNAVKGMVHLANRSGRLLSALVFPLFFFFLIYRTELITVILSDKFLPAVPIFAVSVLAMPLRAYSFTTILQNRHRGDVINKGALIDLIIACVLMYPLYKLVSLPGIALSFVISSYLQAAYYVFHTSGELKVPAASLLPLSNWVIKLIAFALLFIGFYYLSTQLFTRQFVLILGGLFTGIICICSLWLELVNEKRKYGTDQEA